MRSRHGFLSPFELAKVHASLGDADEAFRQIEEAVRLSDPSVIFVNVVSLFDPLHTDPRFRNLLRRLRLPPATTR